MTTEGRVRLNVPDVEHARLKLVILRKVNVVKCRSLNGTIGGLSISLSYAIEPVGGWVYH